jgi:hypothetical protein
MLAKFLTFGTGKKTKDSINEDEKHKEQAYPVRAAAGAPGSALGRRRCCP